MVGFHQKHECIKPKQNYVNSVKKKIKRQFKEKQI